MLILFQGGFWDSTTSPKPAAQSGAVKGITVLAIPKETAPARPLTIAPTPHLLR
jgi:hypothetical protein